MLPHHQLTGSEEFAVQQSPTEGGSTLAFASELILSKDDCSVLPTDLAG